MIAAGHVRVPAVGVEDLTRAAIGLGVAIDRIAVQPPGEGLIGAGDALQMQRRDVVMVIIRQPAVPAILIQLADGVGILAPVIARIENGHAVHRQRHRAALEIIRSQRDRRQGRHRHERELPDVHLTITERAGIAVGIGRHLEVRSRQRNLLLPAGDTDHQVRHQRAIGQAIRFLVKISAVPVKPHLGAERREGGRHQRAIAGGGGEIAGNEKERIRPGDGPGRGAILNRESDEVRASRRGMGGCTGQSQHHGGQEESRIYFHQDNV